MPLDLGFLSLIAAFAIAGYYSGAVKQLAHWIGLGAALLSTKPAAAMMGPAVAAQMGWGAALVTGVLSTVLFPLIFFIASVVARIILNLIEPGEERGTLDQGLGVVVGGAKGGAIMFALMCLALTFEKPLARVNIDLDAKTRGSYLAAFARGHNIFADSDQSGITALKKMLDENSDPKQRAEFLKNPEFKALLGDSAVQDALKSGDASALLKNPAIKKLLENPEIAKKLEKL